MMPTSTIAEQLEALEKAGVFALAGEHEEAAREAAAVLRVEAASRSGAADGTLVALHPRRFAASALAPLMTRNGRPGFVVEDMVDVDEFTPAGFDLPEAPLYLAHGVSRGDDLRNVSPEEALARLGSGRRRPLTLHEGLAWALIEPDVIEPNACFMTIGSRRVKRVRRSGEVVHDARTPALWISSGTGRDGRDRRGAPKLGWCWWRNRHTWLGIASAEP